MSTPSPQRFSEKALSKERLPMVIAFTLSGKGPTGEAFVEKTTTVVINQTGAKVLTKRRFNIGDRVTITYLRAECRATVVWLGETKGEQQEVGLDLDEAKDFWGVRFPKEKSDSPAPGLVPAPAPAPASAIKKKVTAPAPPAPPPHQPAPVPAAAKPAATPSLSKPLAAPPAPLPGVPAAAVVGAESYEKISGLIKDMVRKAIEESLTEALQKLTRRVEHSDWAHMEVLQRSQDVLSRVVEAANAKLEANAAKQVAAVEQAYHAALEKMAQEVEGRLAWFFGEYEQRLEAVSEKLLQELADRVAGLPR